MWVKCPLKVFPIRRRNDILHRVVHRVYCRRGLHAILAVGILEMITTHEIIRLAPPLLGERVKIIRRNQNSVRVRLLADIWGSCYKAGDEITVQPYELKEINHGNEV